MNCLKRQDYEYLLGAYLGDGTPYGRYGIKMTTVEDDYRDVLLDVMSPLSPRVGLGKDTYHRIYAGVKENPCAQLFVPYKKSGVWNLPKIEYPEELIAGIFDTDGSMAQRKGRSWNAEIIIYQRHRANLELLIPFLEDMCIFPALYGNKSSEMHSLHIMHWTQARIFAVRIPSRHPRKKEFLEKAKSFFFYSR